MRKRGLIRTFDKLMYRKSPIIPSLNAVKTLNNRGYSARTVKYANGDKSLFINKRMKPKRAYFAPKRFPKSNTPSIARTRIPYFDRIESELSIPGRFIAPTELIQRMANLRKRAYSSAKELRWLVIREKNSGNLLSMGLVPEPIARMHLDLLGFDVNRLNSLNEWKKQEGNMTFGLNEPIGQQLIDLQQNNPSLSPSYSMERISDEFKGELEYVISPERAKFEETLSDERIEDLIEITGKTPNPFMGERDTEFFRLYSWFPESALYLSMYETDQIIKDAYYRINNEEKDASNLNFTGINMMGIEGLKNDIGIGLNLQTESNEQFYQDMKNVQRDKWELYNTKPYDIFAIREVAEDYGVEDDLLPEKEYKKLVISQLEGMYMRGDDPYNYAYRRWEDNGD
tara:strand:+ start:26916 stop:28112 length:1197 start_codon:yes stop_codon:yes gene_type:complete